jgi:ubiquinone/menaquinone biosynthesis C-methylase UbiE
LLSPISRHFRARRMATFLREINPAAETRILDVGGTPATWSDLPVRLRVVILNMPRESDAFDGMLCVGGDGCALPFRDQSFDIVFSNSVIEHVGSWEKQQRFAAEVARVGRRYWVQTPNRYFPVETHLLTPFLHWLPRSWQAKIAPRFTVWSMLTSVDREQRDWYVRHFLHDIRLLDARQMAQLFPGARMIRERACGLVKSLIAVR